MIVETVFLLILNQITFQWAWTKFDSIWFKIKRKTETMIIFNSIWKEIYISECKVYGFWVKYFSIFYCYLVGFWDLLLPSERRIPLGIMGARLSVSLKPLGTLLLWGMEVSEEQFGPKCRKRLSGNSIVIRRTRETSTRYHAGLRDLTHLCPPLRSTFAVRETQSLGQ